MTEALAMTWWPSLIETVGEYVAEQSWTQLGKWLALAQPRPEDPERPRLAGWSPARFRDDTRDLERVLVVSALALDVDKGAVPLERIRAAFAGRAVFVHSTRRSTPAEPRWRIVCRLSRDVTADEHRQLWHHERERLSALGIALDVSPKDASRFWYVPCEPAEGSYVFEELDGAPLDVDAALAVRVEPGPVSRETARASTPQRNVYGERALEDACRRVASAANGARNNTLNDQAHGIAQLVAGGVLDEDLARRRLADAAAAAGLATSETAKTIASAFKAGKEKPRTKPEREPAPAPSASPALAERPRAPGDRVRALAKLGPVVRLATSIPTLDRACRGGIPTRRLVVVGGAPGAGKTSVVTDWAWRWLELGASVTFLAIDEGEEGFYMRTAQRHGLDPHLVEDRDPETLERLARIVESVPLVLLSEDDVDGTVEGAAARLAAMPSDRPRVLLVDSMQTVRTSGTDAAESPRDRVDAVTRALKHARDAHGFLVVATCELARGAYRSRNVAETISDLAAFKESGGIEYAAQTALVLRSVPDESCLIDVTVPKNRAYRRDPFRLRMDHRTTMFAEVDVPVGEAPSSDPRAARETAKVQRHRRQVNEDAKVLEHIVARNPGIGERKLRAAIAAAGHKWGPIRLDAAKLQLGARLTNRGDDRESKWFIQATAPAEGASDAV